ncbi:MAG: hypothetical protein MZV70_08645 [Desulfobacterales bacterium]|nr:hypothetical protein [Desulfobacterales bacterium]
MAIGGAKVFFLPDHELPLIDMTIYVKAGAVDLQDSEAGLTDLLDGTIIRGRHREPLAGRAGHAAGRQRHQNGCGHRAGRNRHQALRDVFRLGERARDPAGGAHAAALRRQSARGGQGAGDGQSGPTGRRRPGRGHAGEHDLAFQGPPLRPGPAGGDSRSFRPSPGMTCGVSSPPISFPPTWWWRFQGTFSAVRSRRAWGASSAGLPAGAAPQRQPRRTAPDAAGRDPDPQTRAGAIQCRGRAARASRAPTREYWKLESADERLRRQRFPDVHPAAGRPRLCLLRRVLSNGQMAGGPSGRDHRLQGGQGRATPSSRRSTS